MWKDGVEPDLEEVVRVSFERVVWPGPREDRMADGVFGQANVIRQVKMIAASDVVRQVSWSAGKGGQCCFDPLTSPLCTSLGPIRTT